MKKLLIPLFTLAVLSTDASVAANSCEIALGSEDLITRFEIETPLVTGGITPYSDPFYQNLLVPGRIDYTRIFSGIDSFADVRRDVVAEFRARVRNMQMDENGMIRIRIKEDPHFLAAYRQAMIAAFQPFTGLQVGATVISRHVFSNPFIGGSVHYNLDIILIPNINAEAQIEQFKYESARTLEQLASQVRNDILKLHSRDFEVARKAGILAKAFGEKPTLNEILEALEDVGAGDQVHKLDLTIDFNNVDWIKTSTSTNLEQRKRDLSFKLDLLRSLNQCLANGDVQNKVKIQRMVKKLEQSL